MGYLSENVKIRCLEWGGIKGLVWTYLTLKEDEQKLQGCGLQLKQVPELIKGELANLEEEHKEIDEKIQELLSLYETPCE